MRKKIIYNKIFFILILFLIGFFSDKIFAANLIHPYVVQENLKKIKKILQECPEKITSLDKLGRTPICLASSMNRPELVNYLLQFAPSISEYFDGEIVKKEDKNNMTPLYWACFHNNLEIFRLLGPYIDGKTANLVSAYGWITPFLWACYHSNQKMFDLLLPYCSKKTIYDPRCLTFAIKKNNSHIVKILLEYGVKSKKYINRSYIDSIKKNINKNRWKIRNYLVAAWYFDCYTQSEKIKLLKKLLLRDTKISNQIFNFWIKRLFSESLKTLNFKFFFKILGNFEQKIFEKAFKALPIMFLHKQDTNGNTLLSLLVEKNFLNKSLIKIIASQSKKSVNMLNKNRETPFMIACKKNNLLLFKVLLPYCMPKTINQRDLHTKATPLNYAIAHNNLEMVKLLLENNAKIPPIECKRYIRKKIKKYIRLVKLYTKRTPFQKIRYILKNLIEEKDQEGVKFIIKLCFSRSMRQVMEGKKTFTSTIFFGLFLNSQIFKSSLEKIFKSPPVAMLNHSGKLGQTTLSILLWNCCIDKKLIKFVKLLLPHFNKETINMINVEGQTPLYWSCLLRDEELFSCFLMRGSKEHVNQPDIFGYTPLHRVCEAKCPDMAKAILPYCTIETKQKRNKNGEIPRIILKNKKLIVRLIKRKKN